MTSASQSELLGPDDRMNWNDLQSNFCSVIIVGRGIDLLCDDG